MSYLEYVTVGGDESPDSLQELQRVNHFNVADLNMNRMGKISPGQKGVLFRRALTPMQYPFMALVGWVFAYFVFTYGVPGFLRVIIALIGGKAVTGTFVVFTAFILGAFGIAVFKTSRLMVLLMKDLSDGTAARLDGRVSVSQEEFRGLGLDRLHKRGQRVYHYVIKNESFLVDEAAAEVLAQGGRYCVYHTPNSKLLLSIEPSKGN
jgi:hypothetical protein